MEISPPKEISRQKVTCFYSEWPLFYQVSYRTAEKVREEINALVSHKDRVRVCNRMLMPNLAVKTPENIKFLFYKMRSSKWWLNDFIVLLCLGNVLGFLLL